MDRRSFCAVILGAAVIVSGCGATASAPPGMMDAGAAHAEIVAALKDVPLPPGATILPTIHDQSGTYQVGYGRTLVEGLAMCAWFRYWLAAIEGNRPADATRAADIAKLFPTWVIYRDGDISYTSLIDAVVRKANLGDLSSMGQFVAANCAT
jgi:hypothetical protein